MDMLQNELRRLYFNNDPQGYSLQPAAGGVLARGPLTGLSPDRLVSNLRGDAAVGLELVNPAGMVRVLVIGFERSLDWPVASLLWETLQEELKLPAPGISVNGERGYCLWLSLAEPVPLDQATAFLDRLRRACLSGLPATAVQLLPSLEPLPNDVMLPPCRHPVTGKWTAFVRPDMASVFMNEPWLDFPPNPETQALLLAGLDSIRPEAFTQALETLRSRTDYMQQPVDSMLAEVPTGPRAPTRTAPANPPGAASLLQDRAVWLNLLSGDRPAVVPTPFPRLNDLLPGGFPGGCYYLLGAPPKSGKTTWAAICMDHAAALGHPVLYVGYGMSRRQLLEAALARKTGIDAARIVGRRLQAPEMERVRAALTAYLETEGRCLELWEAGLETTLAAVTNWALRPRSAMPVPLIVIDELQLLRTGLPQIDDQRYELRRLRAVAVACKDLARRSGAAVLGLAVTPESEEDESELLVLMHGADGVLELYTRSDPDWADVGAPACDPWTDLLEPAYSRSAVAVQRALAHLEEVYPACDGLGDGTRARLALSHHRGPTGSIALYYRRAFQVMEAVDLPTSGDE